jgi:hypothetical protein
MATKYTPSVNIFRDHDAQVNYLPTPNATRVAAQIATDFDNGLRSFTIIGSYGTGKSSFLWALSNVLRGKKHFFDAGSLEKMKVEVIPFVGEFCSATEFLGQKLLDSEASPEQIFAEIYHRYHQLSKKNGLLVLMVDEFGKFLEHAAKNDPEKELYFLQQLAEFVNNPEYNILLLTTLHQNFDAYSFSLGGAQRQEWSKVKGRFREITFNEPVEQLLLLAGERLSEDTSVKPDKERVAKATKLFLQSKAFQFNPDFAAALSLKLRPLDLFSASAAALAMRRYGQNERSLFSFLEGTEHTGIKGEYNARSNPFYNLANLHDNLVFNYYSFINSKYNPDFSAWASIKGALEKVENELDEHLLSDCLKLVKAAGLLNIFAAKGSNLDSDFLLQYAEICLGIEDPNSVLQALTDSKILFYRNYLKRFIINEGTDVDIESELMLAGDQVGEIEDVVNLLNKHFSFPAVFAKEYYYFKGTPRIFEFVISKHPETNLTPMGDTDGYVNLLFNEKLTVEQVTEISKKHPDKAILYGVFKNADAIRSQLKDIEKTKKTKENIPSEDRVAQRELDNIKQHQEAFLNHIVMSSLYGGNNEVFWVFNGEMVSIQSKRDLNRHLTEICNQIYSGTPIYRSELVNRSKLSSQIHTAKRIYFRHLVNHWGEEDLGFNKDKFPPEKTIYLTLLRENGLESTPQNLLAAPTIPESSNFYALWNHGELFLEKTKKHRLPLTDFSESLAKPPFKLKQGLIDFWLPTFLFLKRDEFALFGKGIYIPEAKEETLELLAKCPDDFTIKAFDVAGVRLDVFNRYRLFLNQGTKGQPNNRAFVETIRPFLTFYKGLKDYAKHTTRLQKESIAVRQMIAMSTDPEKTFFEDFPKALGITLNQLKKSPEVLEDYINRLQEAIREIRSCHDELVNRFELFIKEEVLYETLPFEAYKVKLRERFKAIKQHRLLPHHKTLLLRLSSELDDRNAWLSSIAQAVVGKTLENLRDDDEPLLYDKFKNLVLELDTLTQLSQSGVDEEKEEAFGLEITTFETVEKKVVRFPKKKKAEISRIEEAVRTQLGGDKTLNIAALANLLKDLLKK